MMDTRCRWPELAASTPCLALTVPEALVRNPNATYSQVGIRRRIRHTSVKTTFGAVGVAWAFFAVDESQSVVLVEAQMGGILQTF